MLLSLFGDPQSYHLNLRDQVALSDPAVEIYRQDEMLRITLRETGYVVVIPATTRASERCRTILRFVRRCYSELFAWCEIEQVRVNHRHRPYESILVDALIYKPYRGVSLEEVVTTPLEPSERERLYVAVTLLDEELSRCNATLDLTPENITLAPNGRLYPYHLTNLMEMEGEGQSISHTLREWIATGCGERDPRCEVEIEPYDRFCEYIVGKYAAAGYPHEGRVLVRSDEDRYGFVDESGEVVVETKYLSADDFCEGRAVVESFDGWGAIDLWGVEIIPTIYESLGYNDETGIFFAKQNNQWCYISYTGKQLTPFTDDYPDEDISM